MNLLSNAITEAAKAPEAKQSGTEWAFGPIAVGSLGVVGVVEVEFRDGRKFLYARTEGIGRPKSMPLAACAALVDALREAESADAEESPASDTEEESPSEE
jgi:hypothetical protein